MADVGGVNGWLNGGACGGAAEWWRAKRQRREIGIEESRTGICRRRWRRLPWMSKFGMRREIGQDWKVEGRPRRWGLEWEHKVLDLIGPMAMGTIGGAMVVC